MKIKKPKNSNYCATVIEITTLKPLENADRVQGAIIFGNQVIVSLETKVGDIGLYFPAETQLSIEFCKENNLHRHTNLNKDETKSGYFEDNRRVKTMKFRGNKSEGFYIPIESLNFTLLELKLKENDEFDELGTILICNKYVPKHQRIPGLPGTKGNKKAKSYKEKLVDNQFRFHQDTSMLYKNLHKIKPDSLISITYKLHGTSGISSKILHNRDLSIIEKVSKFFGAKVQESEYKDLCSSRKVIKTITVNPKAINNHYYNEDIWSLAHKDIKDFLEDGLTLYYEIVGYLPSGSVIQKDYDYGYTPEFVNENIHKSYGIYIYRITYTNTAGKVFEFSAKQVQNWCSFRTLNAVPELFYGTILNFMNEKENVALLEGTKEFNEHFLDVIKKRYNDKDCKMCNNTVPEEGCVIRIESGEGFEAYKQKSFKFYARESKDFDKGVTNIEDEN